MNHHGRWRIGALASAIALLGSLASLEAHALALGRITVQSALGESLRAEIDISDLSPEEASSLRISVAGTEAFKSAGLEYSAIAAGLEIKLQKRADGRSYLRLSSNRAIADPFVDLILEARWASGRVTRDYTLLFDPPNLRATGTGVASSAPVLSREPVTSAAIPSRQDTPAATPRPAPRVAPPAPRPLASRISPAEKTPGARHITVRPGDNASRIAAQNKPASISLDQMLVALLRANPEAFMGGNINLIKSGAVVQIPDERAASALNSTEAKQTLIAQSRDFNTFRRKLAQGVPAAQLDRADRQTSGKIQARVDDQAQAALSPDKLTLSKGAVQGVQSGDRPAKDATGQPATSPLNNAATPPLLPGSAAATPVPAGTAPVPGSAASNAVPGGTGVIAAAPAAPPPLPGAPEIGAALPSAANSTGQPPLAPASQPVPDASAPAVSAASAANQATILTAPPVTPGESSLANWFLNNSLLLGGGAVLALLAGLGIFRYRKNQKTSQMDSLFLDNHLQQDSFFGASGGQRVDTSVSHAGRSSVAYASSQVDTAGDVDPVAEAEVYLAYGRDQQAEEILTEALRSSPSRIAIHTKLLEIAVKRRDHKAFESLALTAFSLSNGQGPEWTYISQLGRELEPSNSLYQSGQEPLGDRPEKSSPGLITPWVAAVPQDSPVSAPALKTAPSPDLDLDLDLNFDDAQAVFTLPVTLDSKAPSPTGPIAPWRSGATAPSAFMDLDLDLDNAPDNLAVLANPAPVASSPVARPASLENDFFNEGLDFTPAPHRAPKAAAALPQQSNHEGMLEFDLNSLSLDLGPATGALAAASTAEQDNALEIKFLLAEEFRILGDSDGARALADEVVANAKGALKFKAQAFLSTLS